ncbi:MAG: Universal stress protein family, partial [uncultured Nocardioidaceae bacterium]
WTGKTSRRDVWSSSCKVSTAWWWVTTARQAPRRPCTGPRPTPPGGIPRCMSYEPGASAPHPGHRHSPAATCRPCTSTRRPSGSSSRSVGGRCATRSAISTSVRCTSSRRTRLWRRRRLPRSWWWVRGAKGWWRASWSAPSPRTSSARRNARWWWCPNPPARA